MQVKVNTAVHRGSTVNLMAVRSLPSISTVVKAGMQMTSIPSWVRNPLAMATALTAWFTAPAPIAWTSARLLSRTKPAIAPATADDLDLAATLMMSIVAVSLLIALREPGAISCMVWRESHIIEAWSELSYYYFTRLLEQKQDPSTTVAVQAAHCLFAKERIHPISPTGPSATHLARLRMKWLWAHHLSLFGIVNGPGLADDCNLDLARILQAFLYFRGNIFGQLD